MLEYVQLLWRDAWKEASAFALPATGKAWLRAIGILTITVVMMVAFQPRLTAVGLIPAGSNEATKKLVAAAFGVGAAAFLFAIYLLAELIFIAPYRLWHRVKPPPATATSHADEHTKQLAGLVNALRERVMHHGFKRPVVADDSYYAWRATLEASTHPIFIEKGPLQARRDFLHATAVLPHANEQHEPREEIDYWRTEVDRSADELIRHLLPS